MGSKKLKLDSTPRLLFQRWAQMSAEKRRKR
jgi:hypothetical protein